MKNSLLPLLIIAMLNLAGCSKSDEQSNQNPDPEDKHVVKDAKYWQDLLNLSDEELKERIKNERLKN